MNNYDDTLKEEADRQLFAIQLGEEEEEEEEKKKLSLMAQEIEKESDVEVEEEIDDEVEKEINGEIEDLKSKESLLENKEIHSELKIKNTYNFFHEFEYVDFLGVTKFDYISINPLLQIISTSKF